MFTIRTNRQTYVALTGPTALSIHAPFADVLYHRDVRVRYPVSLLIALLASCSTPPRDLDWHVELPMTRDEAVRMGVASYEVGIVAGNCGGGCPSIAGGYRDAFVFGEAGRIPNVLPPGPYAFVFRALDAGCNTVACGCAPVVLPQPDGASVTVAPTLMNDGLGCEGRACVDGLCTIAAIDAATTDSFSIYWGWGDTLTSYTAPADSGPADSSDSSTADSGDTGTVDSGVSCRMRPDLCVGRFDGYCDAGACSVGECCSLSFCGTLGRCTNACGSDGDCPTDMLCAHGYCFPRCSDDTECFDSGACDHSGTACHWV
jgi:hypothetical protein